VKVRRSDFFKTSAGRQVTDKYGATQEDKCRGCRGKDEHTGKIGNDDRNKPGNSSFPVRFIDRDTKDDQRKDEKNPPHNRIGVQVSTTFPSAVRRTACGSIPIAVQSPETKPSPMTNCQMYVFDLFAMRTPYFSKAY
jgi:hypothetical protein